MVEDQVTYPLSTALLAVPGAKTVRGISMFGDTLRLCSLRRGTDLYWARSRVLEYLSQVAATPAAGGPSGTRTGRHRGGLDLRIRAGRPDRAARPQPASCPPGLVPQVRAAADCPASPRWQPSAASSSQYQVIVDPDQRCAPTDCRWRRCARPSRGPTRSPAARCWRWPRPSSWSAPAATSKASTTPRSVPRQGQPRRRPGAPPGYRRDPAGAGDAPRRRELDGEGEAVGGIVVMRWGENALETIDGRQGQARRACGQPARGRRDRHDLRPLRPDRAGHRQPARTS